MRLRCQVRNPPNGFCCQPFYQFQLRAVPVPPLSILYTDNHLLVVDKPAGIATMGAPQDTATIARQAALYLQQKHNKPGKAFIGVVSRLDRLVSGVLVLARTSKAASRLSEQLRQHSVKKFYLAIVEGNGPTSSAGMGAWREIVDWVAKDESVQRMRVVDPSHPQAKLARLRVQPLASSGERTLLKIELLTGRKHQIRLQLAEQGTPICGDSKYASRTRFASGSGRGEGIALHCQQLTLTHPTLQQTMVFQSSPLGHWLQLPEELRRRLEELSG
jgi:23S rRNA pseudouridine1911/1915/1917 synthase